AIGKIVDGYLPQINTLSAAINTADNVDAPILSFWMEVAPKHLQISDGTLSANAKAALDKVTGALKTAGYADLADWLDPAKSQANGAVHLIDPDALDQQRKDVFAGWKAAAETQAAADYDFKLNPDDLATLKAAWDKLKGDVWIKDAKAISGARQGVATSTSAFLGETERGRTKPRLVTSFNEYRRHFGSVFADGKYMPDAVSGFFENGGRRAFICRILGPDATVSTRTAGGLQIDAIGPGAWGDRVFVKIVESSTKKGDTPIGFRLQVAYWQTPSPDGNYADPFDRTQPPRLPLPTLAEDFDNLVWDDRTSPDYFEKRLQDNSALVTVTAPAPLTTLPSAGFDKLTGGADASAAPGVSIMAPRGGSLSGSGTPLRRSRRATRS
ncbi:hypothetical protein LTR94_026929, partial [Friedmanniomyces endolithicus]